MEGKLTILVFLTSLAHVLAIHELAENICHPVENETITLEQAI